jgi:hypothetical protein
MPSERDPPAGGYGAGLARCFGLAGAPALVTQLAPGATFAVTRLDCPRAQAGRRHAIPIEDAFLVTLHLRAARRLELWLRGQPVPLRPMRPGSMLILDLRGDVVLRLGGTWDVLGFYVPRALLGVIGLGAVGALASEGGVIDPVLGHLGAAALGLLERPRRPTAAVLRHLATATCAHLVHRYGAREAEEAGDA